MVAFEEFFNIDRLNNKQELLNSQRSKLKVIEQLLDIINKMHF